MARNGSGVYSLPAGSIVTAGETAIPSQHNDPLNDLAADANTARPVVAGGTGATTASDARTNLGITLANLGLTATATELDYTAGVTSAIQTQIDAKAPIAGPTFTGTINGAAATFSGEVGSSGVNVTNATAALATLNDSGGVSGAAVNARIVFEAAGTEQGYVGFETSVGVLRLSSDVGNIYSNVPTGSVNEMRVNDVVRIRANDSGATINGTFSAPAMYDRTQVGAMAFAAYAGSTATVTHGDSVAGTDLVLAGVGSFSAVSGSALSGTWVCLGHTTAASDAATLFVRTA